MRINVPAKLGSSEIYGFRDPSGNALYGAACLDKDIIMNSNHIPSSGVFLPKFNGVGYINGSSVSQHLDFYTGGSSSSCSSGWNSDYSLTCELGYTFSRDEHHTYADNKCSFKIVGWFSVNRLSEAQTHAIYLYESVSGSRRSSQLLIPEEGNLSIQISGRDYQGVTYSDSKTISLSEGNYGFYISISGFSAQFNLYNSSGLCLQETLGSAYSEVNIFNGSYVYRSLNVAGMFNVYEPDIQDSIGNSIASELGKLSNNLSYRKYLWGNSLVYGISSIENWNSPHTIIGAEDPAHNYFVGQENFSKYFNSDSSTYVGYVIIFPQFTRGQTKATINFTVTSSLSANYKVGTLKGNPSSNYIIPGLSVEGLDTAELACCNLNSSTSCELHENGESEWPVLLNQCKEFGNTVGNHSVDIIVAYPSDKQFPYIFLPRGCRLNSVVYS